MEIIHSSQIMKLLESGWTLYYINHRQVKITGNEWRVMYRTGVKQQKARMYRTITDKKELDTLLTDLTNRPYHLILGYHLR